MMTIIFVSGNKQNTIFNNNQLETVLRFPDTSVGYHNTASLVVLSDSPVLVSGTLGLGSQYINFYEGSARSETQTPVQIATGSWFSYQLKMVFSPQPTDGNFRVKHGRWLNLKVGDTLIEFAVESDGVDDDPKLIEMLQNFRVNITPDYETAFFVSNNLEPNDSKLVMNSKRKEYMLNLLNLTGYIGAYKSLLSALDYFGYGDLLELREIWQNEDIRTATAIGGEVVDAIDIRLSGFRKTGDLQLIYQINHEDGTLDADGIHNYVDSMVNLNQYLPKMYALRRVLEKDFLALNTSIVDIIAVHTTESGYRNVTWLNEVRIGTNYMSEMGTVGFEIKASHNGDVFISNHSVLLMDANLNYVDGKILPIDPNTTTFNKKFFDILSVIEDEDTNTPPVFGESTYFTSAHRGNFGLIRCEITSAYLNAFSRYVVILKKKVGNTTTEAYRSPLRAISAINGELLVGVGELGTFELSLILFDKYGGFNPVSLGSVITVSESPIKIQTARLRSIGETTRDIRLVSTFKTLGSGRDLVDPINTSYDVNIPGVYSNVIGRLVNKPDAPSMDITLSETKGIPLSKMNGVALSNYAHRYANIIIDILGANLSKGMRTVRIRFYDHREWTTISLSYSEMYKSQYEFIQDFVTLLNGHQDLTMFSFSVDYLSYNRSVSEKKPVIRMTAKQAGMLESHINISVDAPDLDLYISRKNTTFFSAYDGSMRIVHSHNDLGELKVVCDGKIYTQNLQLFDLGAVVTALESLRVANKLNYSVFTDGLFANINSRVPLEISHPSIGRSRCHPFGNEYNSFVKTNIGSDYRLGELIVASVDEMNRFDVADIVWVLSDAVTGAMIDLQRGYVFRKRMLTAGSYSLSLTASDGFGTQTTTLNGCFVVN